MLKRLWYIFGPIIISLTLLLLLLLFLPVNQSHDLYTEKKAATALTPIVFKNTALKQQALSDPNHRFVPFFGSSEWTRLDSMHPSVLAEAYHRKYTPFLLGLKGAESLTQYFGMQQIKPELKNKKRYLSFLHSGSSNLDKIKTHLTFTMRVIKATIF